MEPMDQGKIKESEKMNQQSENVSTETSMLDEVRINNIENYLKRNWPQVYEAYYIGDGKLRHPDLKITISFDGHKWLIIRDDGKSLKTGKILDIFEDSQKSLDLLPSDCTKIELLCRYLKEAFYNGFNPHNELFEVLPLIKIVEKAKPIEWLVKDLIPRNGLVVLCGKAGAGKSFLALSLAHAIVTKGKAFECLEVLDGGRVLIVDGENPPSLYKYRVEAMALNSIDGIDIVLSQAFSLDSEDYLEALESEIKRRNYRLIIFDAWSDFIKKLDENSAIDVTKTINQLRRIAFENGCSFLIIHHARKSLAYSFNQIDDLRGSSALANSPDLVLFLTADKFGRILKTVKNRFGKHLTLKIDFKDDGTPLKIIGEVVENEPSLNEVEKAMESILKYMADRGGEVKTKHLTKELPYSERTIYRALDGLMKTGRIKRVKRGHYRLSSTLIDLDEFEAS